MNWEDNAVANEYSYERVTADVFAADILVDAIERWLICGAGERLPVEKWAEVNLYKEWYISLWKTYNDRWLKAMDGLYSKNPPFKVKRRDSKNGITWLI